jgi:hypothetical protein
MIPLYLGLLLLVSVAECDPDCSAEKYESCITSTTLMTSLDLPLSSIFDMSDFAKEMVMMEMVNKDENVSTEICRIFQESVTPCWQNLKDVQCKKTFTSNSEVSGSIDAVTMLCQIKEFLDDTSCLKVGNDELSQSFEDCRRQMVFDQAKVPLETQREGSCIVRHSFNSCLSDAMEEQSCSQSDQNLVMKFNVLLRYPRDILFTNLCSSDGKWKPNPNEDNIIKDCGYMNCFIPMTNYNITWDINTIIALTDETMIFTLAKYDNKTIQEICRLYSSTVLPCWDDLDGQCDASDISAAHSVNSAWNWMCNDSIQVFMEGKNCLNSNIEVLMEPYPSQCMAGYQTDIQHLSTFDYYFEKKMCNLIQDYKDCTKAKVADKCSKELGDFYAEYSRRVRPIFTTAECSQDTNGKPHFRAHHMAVWLSVSVVLWITQQV